MNIKILTRLIGTAVLVNLSACSSIKELFPDKEKDYQFTTEIPKLIIPGDLAKGGSLSPSSASTANTETAQASTETAASTDSEAESKPEATAEDKAAAPENTSSDDTAATDTPADDQPPIDPKSITAELLQSSNNITYLRLNVPFAYAWRIVSKGLSRKSLEVSERNKADKTFTVQYDPNEKKVEDGSYMDEINFMLNGFQSNEKEYLLKLVETDNHTDVVILNDEQKPSSDEGGLKLLQVLQKTIKANLAGK